MTVLFELFVKVLHKPPTETETRQTHMPRDTELVRSSYIVLVTHWCRVKMLAHLSCLTL